MYTVVNSTNELYSVFISYISVMKDGLVRANFYEIETDLSMYVLYNYDRLLIGKSNIDS
jgi:hypothetical protein